jgi:hypothetical protein
MVNKLQQFTGVLEIHENAVAFEDSLLHKPKPCSDLWGSIHLFLSLLFILPEDKT